MAKGNKKRASNGKKCQQKRNSSRTSTSTSMSAIKSKNTPKLKTRLDKSDQIEKSKQLLLKTSISKTTNRSSSCNNNESRMCGNGKPMPSLADLEKMFEESDDETELSTQSERKLTPNNSAQSVIDLTPKTLKKIGGELLDFISDEFAKTDTIIMENMENHSPAMSQKKSAKRTNSWVSNICIDCDSDSSNDNVDSRPKKRAKIHNNSQVPGINNIPNNSSVSEKNDLNTNEGSDSDVTIIYDADLFASGRFSPLPSTSRDSKTISKNERNFNASFNTLNESIQHVKNTEHVDNTQPIENTHDQNTQSVENTDVEVLEPPLEIITICDDIDPETVTKLKIRRDNNRNKAPSPIIIDDEYCTTDPSISETIDLCDLRIEDVIAENNLILSKINHSNNSLGTVTEVSPTRNNSSNQTNLGSDSNATNQEISMIKPYVEVINLLDDSIPVTNTSTENTNTTRKFNMTNSTADAASVRPETCDDSDLCICAVNLIKYVATNSKARQLLFLLGDSVNNSNHDNTGQNATRNDNENNRFEELLNNNIRRQLSLRNDLLNALEKLNNQHKHTVEHNRENTEICNQNTITTNTIRDKQTTDVNLETVERNFGNCPICMDSLTPKTTASTLCGHIFCMSCIKSALRMAKRCPICRKYLKGAGYHPLFLN